jgi:DNA-binding response OmpR family regulator
MTVAHRPRALVIEDEWDILELLQGHLRRMGYWVSGAQTGERGLALALTDPPDVVLVDIRLPGIDGREVIRRLRTDRRTDHCRIVVCSVLDPDDLADLDADAVLSKPFGRSALARVIKRVTSRGEP